MLESCVRARLTYGTQAWFPNEQELRKLKTSWFQCLRNMVKGGWKRRFIPDGSEDEELEADYGYVYSNEKIQKIIGTQPLENFIKSQYLKYIGHVCRAENSRLTKKTFFAKPTKAYFRDPWLKISRMLGTTSDEAKRTTQLRERFAELVRKNTNQPP